LRREDEVDEAAGVLKQCLAGFPDGRRYASSHCFGTEYLRSTPGMEVPQGHLFEAAA
jgi:hypothetical protein